MSDTPRSCKPSDRLTVAAALMWDHDIGFLPVVDEQDEIVGTITDRDICMAAYTDGRAILEIPVSTAMATHVYTTAADATVEDASGVMRVAQIRRLPAVDEAGKLVGVLSLNDCARYAAAKAGKGLREDVALTLGRICTPRNGETTRPAI